MFELLESRRLLTSTLAVQATAPDPREVQLTRAGTLNVVFSASSESISVKRIVSVVPSDDRYVWVFGFNRYIQGSYSAVVGFRSTLYPSGMSIEQFVSQMNESIPGPYVTIDDGAVMSVFSLQHVQRLHLDMGAGNDFVRVLPNFQRSVTLLGGRGNDTLIGSSRADVLSGGDGGDRLVGADGLSAVGDVFEGGAGSDTLVGSAGQDVMYGGSGNDWLDGGPDTRLTSGGSGSSGGSGWGAVAPRRRLISIGDIVPSDPRDTGVRDYLNGESGFDVAVFDGADERESIEELVARLP